MTNISNHIIISVGEVSIVSMEERAKEILHKEKINLHLGVIEAQHKRLLDEIDSGISQQAIETEIRIGLKTFESNYMDLFKLKNEE